MTITPEERAVIRKIAENTQQLNWTDNIHDKLMRLLDALEKAEATLDAAFMAGLHKTEARAEKAEARIKQLEAVLEAYVGEGNVDQTLRAAGYDV